MTFNTETIFHFFYKTACLNEEVTRTEPCVSMRARYIFRSTVSDEEQKLYNIALIPSRVSGFHRFRTKLENAGSVDI
jgi:hypothetical protein